MYYSGMQGLGQVAPTVVGYDPGRSTIRWWCWDAPGFKECHSNQWESARDFCQQTNAEGYTSMEVCINKEADVLAKLNCPCPDDPPKKSDPGQGGSAKTGALVLSGALLVLLGVVIYRSQRG